MTKGSGVHVRVVVGVLESVVADRNGMASVIVAMFCCHVRRYIRVCDVALQNAARNGCVNVTWVWSWGRNRSAKQCVLFG